MTDETSGAASLKDFLATRVKGDSPSPAAPSSPKNSSPSTPTPIAPSPKREPSWSRRALGAIANEALQGTGHIGDRVAQRIGGRSHVTSARAATTVVSAKANLSKPGTLPKDDPIGLATSVEGIEKQVAQLDKEQRNWENFFVGEIRNVRSDVSKVADIAVNALRGVEQLRKDQATEAFKNKVRGATIRGKNGRYMSGAQALGDPSSVKRDSPEGPGLVKKIEEYLLYGAEGGAGLYGAKKVKNLLSRPATRVGAEVAEREAVKKLGPRLAPRLVPKLLGGAGGSGGIGLSIDMLKTMKDDSQSGNHLRSWLRSKLGIEDPGEAASWKGAMSNDEFSEAKDAQKTAKKPTETEVESENVAIVSKRDISLEATQDVSISAKNEITIKGRTLFIDAQKIEFKNPGMKIVGLPMMNGGGGSGSTAQATATGPSLSASDQRLQEYTQKYGSDKAKELIDKQENRWSDPMTLLKKLNPFSSGSDRGTATPGSGTSGSAGTSFVGAPSSGGSSSSTGTGPSSGRASTDGTMSGDDLRKGVYNAYRAQGYSHQGALTMAGEINRENGFNPNLVFGNHTDPANGAKNSGFLSWQGSRNEELMKHLQSKGALDEGGNIKRDQNSLNAMAEFSKMEMDKKEYGGGRLNETLKGNDFDRSSVADDLGKNYIKWRVDDPKYRGAGVRNREAGFDDTKRAVEGSQGLAQLMQGDTKPSAAAVDLALRNEGLHERKDRDALISYIRKGPSSVDPATTPWCAAYVNASLAQAGIKGSNSDVANSFQRWGVGVDDASTVSKGDILVKPNHHGPGETGGHVGMATGKTRIDKDGNLEMEMVAGNSHDQVSKTWESPNSTMIRRATKDQLPSERPEPVTASMNPFASGPKAVATPAVPAKPAGYELGDGRIAGHIGSDGKLSTMATSFGRSQIISGFGDNFDKLPKDVQDHIKNSSQLDLNKLAPHAGLMPDEMRKGFEKEGLKFTDAVPEKAAVYAPSPSPTPVATPSPGSKPASVTPPVQELDAPPSDPADSQMARDLGAGDLDKKPDASLVTSVPTPPNIEKEDPDAGEKLTDSIKRESGDSDKDSKGSTVSNSSSTGSKGSASGGGSHDDIQAPVNHPESEAPRPGSDGYGDQAHDPDDCGLCAT